MHLKSLVVFSLVLSTSAVEKPPLRCAVPNGETTCASQYCFISARVSGTAAANDVKVETVEQRCGAVEDAHSVEQNEINHWIKKGDLYIQVCDYVRAYDEVCNKFYRYTVEAMKNRESGKHVCYMKDENDLETCYGETKKCMHTHNLKTNQYTNGCADEGATPVGKCWKETVMDDPTLRYFCEGFLCNNFHVCDEQLGLKPPPPRSPPGPAPPGPGQDPKQGSNDTLAPVAPIPTSSPKNTGSCCTVPTVAMLVLIVGAYFFA